MTHAEPSAPSAPPLPASAEQPGDAPDVVDLAAELRVAVMRTSRRLRIEASGDTISAGQYSVLVALSAGPRTLGQLAAGEKVQAPSMTRIVKALEEKGYIERRQHPDDGRQALVEMTAEGLAVLREARGQRTAWLSQRVAELGPDDRGLLQRAARLLQEMSAR